MGRITFAEGDISLQEVDAVVNAANAELQLGSGVAGAIAERGGPAIQEECDAHGPIRVGEAALTGAGLLPARAVIHAAGMSLGAPASEQSVRSATRRSLELADQHGFRSLALPALGAGVGGLSLQRCAELMLEEVRGHLAGSSQLEEVRFVLFGEPAYRVFEAAWDGLRMREQLERMRAQRRS